MLTLQDEREKHAAKMDALRETHAAEVRRLTAEIDELHAQSGKLQQDSSEMHRANIRMHEELAQALTEREDVYRERVTPLQVRSPTAAQAAHAQHALRMSRDVRGIAVVLASAVSGGVRAATETGVPVQKEVAEATAERDELRTAKAELEEQIQDVTEQLTRETEARVDCESELRRVKEGARLRAAGQRRHEAAVRRAGGAAERAGAQERVPDEHVGGAEGDERAVRRARAREERARAQDLPVRRARCCAHFIALQRVVLLERIDIHQHRANRMCQESCMPACEHSYTPAEHGAFACLVVIYSPAACRLENTIRELQGGSAPIEDAPSTIDAATAEELQRLNHECGVYQTKVETLTLELEQQCGAHAQAVEALQREVDRRSGELRAAEFQRDDMHKQCNDKILELDALRTDRQKLQARDHSGCVRVAMPALVQAGNGAASALVRAHFRRAQHMDRFGCVCRRAATA